MEVPTEAGVMRTAQVIVMKVVLHTTFTQLHTMIVVGYTVVMIPTFKLVVVPHPLYLPL